MFSWFRSYSRLDVETLWTNITLFQTLSLPFVCYVIPYIQLLCVSSTAFCLVAVAADLYVMVVRATGPGHLPGTRSRRLAISLIIVWVAAILYSVRILSDILRPSAGADFELGNDDDDSHSDEHEGDEDDDDDECTGILGGMYRYSLHRDWMYRYSWKNVQVFSEACTGILFIETDADDLSSRIADFTVLYLIPIAIQIFFYVKVARRLWSSQVSQTYLFLSKKHKSVTLFRKIRISL